MAEGDELYLLDPEAFVAARNDLVKRLKAEKRKDEADRVARLRRPTPPAWALDQIARSRRELVDAALAAGRRLRDATEAAVGGDASSLRAATADERAAVDAAVDASAERLGGRGPSLRPQLAATLRAAALDDTIADELRRGVLSADHEAPGFGFAGFDVPDQPKDDREERRRRAERQAEAQRLAKRAERLAAAADRLEADARQARAEADAAAAAAEAAASALATP